MALQVEGVVDGGVDAEKSLRRARRLEPLHLPLAPSHDLMRVLGTVVHPQSLLMAAGQLLEGGSVGAQLVGHRLPGGKPLLAKQLAHQPDGCPLIPARLDQEIQNFAFLVDGPP